MGGDTILNREQKQILEKLSESQFIKTNFYFSGGTALSEVYLKHRESIDLDFFSDSEYSQQEVLRIISTIAKDLDVEVESQVQETTQIYFLRFIERNLKLDFAYYPYKRLQEGSYYMGFQIDSKMDIAVNKLMLIGSQRTEVKDFVDLYFLLQEFSVWDLVNGVKVKFNIKLEPYMIATDFTAVKSFDFLPKMHRELSLESLKEFFIKTAREMGNGAVK